MANPSAEQYFPEPSKAATYAAPEQIHYVQQPHMLPGGQVQYVPHLNMQPGGQVQYVPQPYMQPGGQVQYAPQPYMQPGGQIRDWLPWSITNIFVGWLFVGILPLIFSLVCRRYKTSNNLSGARTMSTLALIFNILVTLAGIGGWIGLIVAVATVNRRGYTGCYPYC